LGWGFVVKIFVGDVWSFVWGVFGAVGVEEMVLFALFWVWDGCRGGQDCCRRDGGLFGGELGLLLLLLLLLSLLPLCWGACRLLLRWLVSCWSSE
jgi:hypothetical protein